MSKYLLVDRAQGQAVTAPDAAATSITLTAGADTSEFTAAGNPSATTPISAVLTDSADLAAATKIETVLITAINTGTDVLTLTRNADGVGGEDFSAGSCYITAASTRHLLENMLQRDGDEVKSIGSKQYDNGASGSFDANNGQYQKCVLTSAGTAISASNVKPRSMLTMEIHAAATYAPDISGLAGLWSEGTEPTFDVVNMLHAVGLDDGTVKWIAGRRWA